MGSEQTGRLGPLAARLYRAMMRAKPSGYNELKSQLCMRITLLPCDNLSCEYIEIHTFISLGWNKCLCFYQ